MGFGVAGDAGEILMYVGGGLTAGGLVAAETVVGAEIGLPTMAVGIGLGALGGALKVYDMRQEGQDAKNVIDRAQDAVDKLNEIQRQKQRDIDKLNLFPPKTNPPNCPQSSACGCGL